MQSHPSKSRFFFKLAVLDLQSSRGAAFKSNSSDGAKGCETMSEREEPPKLVRSFAIARAGRQG
jgi:hypothetical protein